MEIKLDNIIELLEMDNPDWAIYFDKQTYDFVTFSQEIAGDAEVGEPYDHLPEWQQDERKAADMVMGDESDRFIRLSKEEHVDEYRMIEDFSYSIKNESKRATLLKAIRGRGAFRRFREHVESAGLLDEWYDFREEGYKQAAREWCEQNDIAYED
ncbi:hypothetical protein LF817_15505 [Halobacillus sp. A1]|uniref:UPF0158 family protein n=1 Tax=Halobacillus sp. A1 TaxID=2880262 RepID=UPI0020A629D4|nr:UPF0158 family protein [Halobacillus sp. A1]MCP3032730.1 hypothetical protein [Halobacillus sp. A1]